MTLALLAPLRRLATLVVLVALFAGAFIGQAHAATDVPTATAEQRFTTLINEARQAAGVAPITAVADVRDVAYAWTERMADAKTLSHNPDYASQYCCWLRAAENVGWATIRDINDPAQVTSAVDRLHEGFMNSEGHRANILQAQHDHVGIGVVVRRNSCPNGVAGDCVWVTQNFRHWSGEQPAGGVRDPYADAPKEAPRKTVVSDDVHQGGFDGDVTTTERLGAVSDTAVEVSTARFADDAATHAVLSRDDRFPDSLAGSPLTGDGPLLFTPTNALSSGARNELRRVLKPGATVYLLGGELALSPAVETAIRDLGFAPRRLAGESRVDTALAIADEVRRLYGDNGKVVIARAAGPAADPNGPAGWVDSITGGAWAAANRVPVVITPTEDLAGSVAAWLAKDAPNRTYLLGGESALSARVAQQAPNSVRIAGEDRAATAAAVAVNLWKAPAGSGRFVVVDGWGANAWQDGLAAAGLAADQSSPLLLASADGSRRPEATAALTKACNAPNVDVLLAGGIDNLVADWLESLDGAAC